MDRYLLAIDFPTQDWLVVDREKAEAVRPTRAEAEAIMDKMNKRAERDQFRATANAATCSRPTGQAAARLAGSRFDQAQGGR